MINDWFAQVHKRIFGEWPTTEDRLDENAHERLFGYVSAELDRLRAELDRFRDALEEIAKDAPETPARWDESGSENHGDLESHGYDVAHSHFAAIARAALAGEGGANVDR